MFKCSTLEAGASNFYKFKASLVGIAIFWPAKMNH